MTDSWDSSAVRASLATNLRNARSLMPEVLKCCRRPHVSPAYAIVSSTQAVHMKRKQHTQQQQHYNNNNNNNNSSSSTKHAPRANGGETPARATQTGAA